MSLDAMKQALTALERGETKLRYEAITALRAAIEKAEMQEPVAWYHPISKRIRWEGDNLPSSWIPLYEEK